MIHRNVSTASKLERAISYLLITGVILSLILEVIGITVFYRVYGNLDVSENERMFIHAEDFFNFIYHLFEGRYAQDKAILTMILGISILILTPYIRVIMSVFYFIWERNIKYVGITLFVLIVLTISLITH